MKHGHPASRLPRRNLLWTALVALPLGAGAATLPDWEFRQEFQTPQPGVLKLSLAPETLNAARAGLEDVRLIGPAGQEHPCLVERPSPATQITRPPRTFRVAVEENRTRVMLEREGTNRLVGLTLQTPAAEFIKAASVQVRDGTRPPETILAGEPLFRQRSGASQLRLTLSGVRARSLELILDDRRSPPIPVQGVQLHEMEAEPPPDEPVAAVIRERVETPGETRIRLDLGAANLLLTSLRIETPEPVFNRRVTVVVRRIEAEVIRERVLASDTLSRIAIDGQPAATRLEFTINQQAPAQEVELRVDNGDSPPLEITRITLKRRPVHLIFVAAEAGRYWVYVGNPRAAAPRYDVARLATDLTTVPAASIRLSRLEPNPEYHPSETLPTIPVLGADLEVKGWAFRKRVAIESPGVQELELDPEILARTAMGRADLRLVSQGKQIPYIIEHTSLLRSLRPAVRSNNDPKQPQTSRWELRLQERSLPVNRLVCESRTPLFTRSVRLYEEVLDDRGEKYTRELGSASWSHTPDGKSSLQAIAFQTALRGDTFYLGTHNGDNPPIDLDKFEVFYPATRLLFKAPPGAPVELYYGNPRVATPRYDLSLVADQLLAAGKSTARLLAQEQLGPAPWQDGPRSTVTKVGFWAVLVLVVVGLLAIIIRLLPSDQGKERGDAP